MFGFLPIVRVGHRAKPELQAAAHLRAAAWFKAPSIN